jgi:hypothetical protein
MFAKSEIRMSKSEIPQCGTKPEAQDAVAAGSQLAGSDFGLRYSDLPIA